MGSFAQIIEYMKQAIWDWIHSIFIDIERFDQSPDKTDVVFILADLMETYEDTELGFSKLNRLKTLLGESVGDFSPSLRDVDESWSKMTIEEREKLVKTIADELIASAPVWGQIFVEMERSVSASDVWWITVHVMPLFIGWHFGTVSNFLYNFKNPHVHQDLTLKEEMHLIDAGLYLNSPYPSALRPARDIDLIISFDFSDGDPFETLKVATEYAAINHHPFPKVDFSLLNPKCPKSYYVFEEKGKPTVIHIPLFNMDNCKSEAQIKEERETYTTFQKPYRDSKVINHLADLAAENVNKELILQEMKKAAQRRKHH